MPAVEFAGALRSAIQASGLTLERVRHRLARRGFPVSVATLSYWQRGRSKPRSAAVVRALEAILELPPATLTDLLDAEDEPGPGRGPGPDPAGLWPDPAAYAKVVAQLDRSDDHRLDRLSVHDVYQLDEHRRARRLSVRNVLRASGDDVDRVLAVHRLDPGGERPQIGGLRYCRPGRVRTAGDLMAFELFFDRVLAAGDTTVVEYELSFPGVGTADAAGGADTAAAAADHYERRFSQPVRDYLAVVRFHADALPARCYSYSQGIGAAPERLAELWIGTSGSAHVALGDVRRIVLGIEWEWD